MSPIGDRRIAVRLEVVGALWGVLEVLETARVLNISRGGALIAAASPLPIDSTRSVRLTVGGEQTVVDARVRHSRPAGGSTTAPSFLIGLEFVSSSPLLDCLDDLEASAGGVL
jgi:hypothetical protein